jgi:hypothetical protein
LKGVVLAGGRGTRLDPLTEITNKHLLPVGREPMIWHPVKQLMGAGIDEIMIITSTHHMGDVVNSLGSGQRFGCQFTYRVQEQAGGIADALALTERFVGGDRVVVLLGDNIFEQLHPTARRGVPRPGARRPRAAQGGRRPGALRHRRAGRAAGGRDRGEAKPAGQQLRRGRLLHVRRAGLRPDPPDGAIGPR